ncbi:MAG TPA: hypothetical protein VE988_09540 [Gemmataceae bacterium]|nr:hypothetical protein [Gemmataceae bacterium]
MGNPFVLTVDPGTLRLPPSRRGGADPAKLQRQIAKHGKSTQGMPLIIVFRGSDGELVVYDGVTRATRVAKLLPGHLVEVEIAGDLPVPGKRYPTIREKLP